MRDDKMQAIEEASSKHLPMDIRAAYVQMVLSLFQTPADDVTRAAIGTKGLISSVAKGLLRDHRLLVRQTLGTLAHIREKPGLLTRKMEADVFSPYLFHQIAELFNRPSGFIRIMARQFVLRTVCGLYRQVPKPKQPLNQVLLDETAAPQGNGAEEVAPESQQATPGAADTVAGSDETMDGKASDGGSDATSDASASGDESDDEEASRQRRAPQQDTIDMYRPIAGYRTVFYAAAQDFSDDSLDSDAKQALIVSHRKRAAKLLQDLHVRMGIPPRAHDFPPLHSASCVVDLWARADLRCDFLCATAAER